MSLFIASFLFSLLYSSLMQSEAVYFSSSGHHLCHPDDGLSLLQFKKEMLDINTSFASELCDYDAQYSLSQYSYPKMISWNKTSSDCCTWDGVTCHEVTGHVIGLDLGCSRVTGVIHQNSSLFHLSHLQKLNLAHNAFYGSEISPNFGGLSCLTHLNFSYSVFMGTIPSKLSYLSKLVLLDLSYNFGLGFNPGDFEILLRNLTHIRELSLYGVHIPTTSHANWSSSLTYLNLALTGVDGKLSNSIFHLPLLQKLILKGNENLSVGLPKSNCLLAGVPNFICSFASLKYLDLSECGLSGSFSNSIGNLSQIVRMYLSGNNFTGNISLIISNLPKLRELDLGYNYFTGQFPSYFGNLTELTMLELQQNLLRGHLPSNMSGFQNLRELDLSNNEFDGAIPSWVFSIPFLTSLSLESNLFTGQIREFESRSLEYVSLRSNQLDGMIPDSIFLLVNISSLDLSSNNLSGSIDFTMFSHLKKLGSLYLSRNKLSLKIENKINISFPTFYKLGLSSCEITEFPNSLQNSIYLSYLDLSNNKLHGQIPNWIAKDSLQYLNLSHNSLSSLWSFNSLTSMKNLAFLDLSSNQFQEPLPLSICNLEGLLILDLSHNKFIGSIPQCFGSFNSQLRVLNLAKNDLKGAISMTFPKNNWGLLNLNLNGNSLEGPLPRSLANCNSLEILDLGNNNINDTFPAFLKNLVELRVLIFKSNRFFGSISNFKIQNCLSKLQVFDLSCNKFSGALPPELFKSFNAMTTLDKTEPKASYMGTHDYMGNLYAYSMSLVMKGNAFELVKIMTTLVAIDLSSNNFIGDVPKIIGDLNLLIVLNLSHNNFSGHIPSALGKLYFLESLDLSWNQIEGEIPLQLKDLTNLAILNLSQNHLWGRIPQGKQFNTFLNDSYYGNLGLCGFPVTKNCGEIDLPSPPSRGSIEDDEDSSFWSEFTWKSVLFGYGFGFGTVCLVLLTGKPNWLAGKIEEVCLYGLLLLGKKEMCKQ